MRILQFADNIEVGGIERIVTDYVIHSSNDTISSALLLYHTDECAVNESLLAEHNKDYMYLDTAKYEKNQIFKKCNAILSRSLRLKQYVKNENVDVIHLHNEPFKYLVLSGVISKNIRFFKTVHSEFQIIFSSKFKIITTSFFIKKYNIQLIALHETMRKELNERFNVTNTVVIRNGIDMERFNPNYYINAQVPLKYELGFTTDDFIVGTVGRLSKEKNQIHLIRTFYELSKRKSNAKLLIVGEGPLREELTQQIHALNLSNKIILTGARSDIPELLSIMDVFVFPSIYEGLPIVLIEAQAMGKKCVVSSAIPKEAHLTETYITLDLELSHEEWCNAILDDAIRTEPVDSLENYDMREVVKQLEALYKGEQ